MPNDKTIDLVGVRPISPGRYESILKPSAMGNTKGIAYGGCAIGNVIHAAYQSSPDPKYHLYSVMGNYLGPTFIDRKLLIYVTPFRTTRSFYTCRVELKQRMDTGEERSVMMALADFMAAEPSMLVYSAPPVGRYADVDNLPDASKLREKVVKNNGLPPEMAPTMNAIFGLMGRFFEQKECPEGIRGQNLSGLAKGVKTTQDHLPITAKTSADWFRVIETESIRGPAEHFAAMGFLMDTALSFIPLTHNHQFLDAASACSSLDFALRFFQKGGDLDMSKWHLREIKTIVGAEGRTYSEGQLWDRDGNMISNMTQQSIMRPAKGVKLQKL